jgi:D-beta-D-heptose 7-phosphate kinase/D-beta-D-heptose 1-phosphate adenosyltransferase
MTLVFVNGCFDVLHRGHIELLKYARSLGHRLKGPTRPINSEEDRLLMLNSIRYVDETRVFNSEAELTELTAQLQPDIMVVGSDYHDKRVIGSEHSKEILFFDRIPNYSTTQILEGTPTGRKLL